MGIYDRDYFRRRHRNISSFPITYSLLLLLVFVFCLQVIGRFISFHIMDYLSFESPQSYPIWRGFYYKFSHWSYRLPYSALFSSISDGEWWRIFTPALMHANIFHLVFNSLWVYLFGVALEGKLSKVKYILLILVAMAITNITQYLASGPFFLGISGVVAFMTGSIWARIRYLRHHAIVNTYSVEESILLFLIYIAVAMALVQFISFLAAFVGIRLISLRIANTAHIAGLLFGYIIGRCNLFRINDH